MRALKEVILAAASLVATVSGRPGLILEHRAASRGRVIHGAAGVGEHRWGSSLDVENVIHRTTVGNKHATGAHDHPRTDPGSVYDPRVSVGRYDSGIAPDEKEPVEVLIEAPVDEPVVFLIEAPVEKPVEILFEIPVEEEHVEPLTGTPFEGPRDGPIEIYVEVSQGLPPEDCDEADGVAAEAPVVDPVKIPNDVAVEAAGGDSVQVENEAVADEKDEDDIAPTPAEETAGGGGGVLAEDSPDEPGATVIPVKATVVGKVPADEASEKVAREGDSSERAGGAVEEAVPVEGAAVHETTDDERASTSETSSDVSAARRTLTNSSGVEAADGDAEAKEGLPKRDKSAALRVSNDDTREADGAPSVNTPVGSLATDREGLGDAEDTVLPAAVGKVLEDSHLRSGDTSDENFPSTQSHDGESPVLRPALNLPSHPTTALPSTYSPSYKYYPGIPVHKQKRKRPRGFLIL